VLHHPWRMSSISIQSCIFRSGVTLRETLQPTSSTARVVWSTHLSARLYMKQYGACSANSTCWTQRPMRHARPSRNWWKMTSLS
jgi:hypothetical protein